MKKIVLFVLLATALRGGADVITNHVYVVSNVFYHVYHENVVTQKVKNTHYNYYYTNNVSVVTNIYETTWRTNMSVNCDIGAQFLVAASNEVNRAESYVGTTEGLVAAAASNSTAAASSASAAAASATAAQNSRTSAASECAAALDQINARINWFDQHSGETITQVNITTNVVIDVNAHDYSYAYTNSSGTAYDNISYYLYGNANGKVAITSVGGKLVTREYLVSINIAYATSGSSWTFEPAYIDTDVYGMKLHYVPTVTNALTAGGSGTYGYDSGKVYVPRDLYWQNGSFHIVIDAYSGATRTGRVRASVGMSSDVSYPNKIENNPPYQSYPRSLSFNSDSREGSIMGSGNSLSPCSLSTATTLPSTDSILWFPEHWTIAQQHIIDWLNSYQ